MKALMSETADLSRRLAAVEARMDQTSPAAGRAPPQGSDNLGCARDAGTTVSEIDNGTAGRLQADDAIESGVRGGSAEAMDRGGHEGLLAPENDGVGVGIAEGAAGAGRISEEASGEPRRASCTSDF